MSASDEDELLRLEIHIRGDEDRTVLRGALLAARATELSELQRRAGRLSYGYGSETARESMDAETRRLRRRIELLDALVEALAHPSSRAAVDAAGCE